MEREAIFSKVQDVFREVFDDDELTISDSTNSDDIDDWDSLNHINLVLNIEKAFVIRFITGEINTLKTVGEMITLMEKKLQAK